MLLDRLYLKMRKDSQNGRKHYNVNPAPQMKIPPPSNVAALTNLGAIC